MRIVSFGKVKLLASVLQEIEVKGYYRYNSKNLRVYIDTEDISFSNINVSKIKYGKFNIISTVNCEVNWIVLCDDEDDIKDYMSWHPIF